MRETKFIEQNKQKWLEFEQLMEEKERNSHQLSKLFIQITDDLSYSRTFYGSRSVRYYLNLLAQKIFLKIYRKKTGKKNWFRAFFLEEIPAIIYEERRSFILSFVFFMMSIGIGVVSSIKEKDFPRQIMGDSYIEMTLKNMKKGDPMAVYKDDGSQVNMFFRLAYNNIRVACYAFIFGIFASIGTLMILLFNGIMLGAFEYFIYDHGFFKESLLAVFLHGTLEISSIVLAGAAGMVLGKGLLFPGTYSRLQAFQMSGQRGMKIILTIIPLLAIAATIEAFITRYTDVPDVFRAIVIFLSLLFIVGYFIWLPYIKNKKGVIGNASKEKILPMANQSLNLYEIRDISSIFADTFYVYRGVLGRLINFSAISALIYAITSIFLGSKILQNTFVFGTWELNNYKVALSYKEPNIFAILNFLLMTFTFYYSMYLFNEFNAKRERGKFLPFFSYLKENLSLFFVCGIAALGLNGYLFFREGGTSLFIFSPLFFVFLWFFAVKIEHQNPFRAITTVIQILKGQFIKLIALYIIMFFMGFIVIFFIELPTAFFSEAVITNLPEEWKNAEIIQYFFFLFPMAFALSMAFPLLIFSQGFMYYASKEIYEAFSLRQKLSELGEKKKSYGF